MKKGLEDIAIFQDYVYLDMYSAYILEFGQRGPYHQNLAIQKNRQIPLSCRISGCTALFWQEMQEKGGINPDLVN